MDSEFRQLERDLQIDPTLIFDYWTACKRAGIVTIYSLITAIREIETILNREFADLYWPAKERLRGLINSMDFRTPESTARSIEKQIYKNVNFHLTPCVCGAPGWSVPCLFCGYENYLGNITESRRILTKEAFVEALSEHKGFRAAPPPPAFDPSRPYGAPSYSSPVITWVPYPLEGNIAKLWVFRNFFAENRFVDEWKQKAWIIGQRAKELVDGLSWPSAAEVWDVYSHRPCEVAGCSYSALNVVSIPIWKFPDLPFDTEVPHLSNRCSRHQEQPFSRNPPFRRNPDEELRNLARGYQMDPSLEHREELFRKMFPRVGASGLGIIFEDYERPLLDAFAAAPTSYYSRLEPKFFNRYSFEKVYEFGNERWGVASLEDASEVETLWEAHLITEITRETPASQYGHPARRSNLALLRSPTNYYIRKIDTNLSSGEVYIEYYSRVATVPLFEGWSRFEKYESAHDTWDYVIETGMGSPTKEEEQSIMKLGYYGQKINKKTVEGLEQGKHFKTIAPGNYLLTIHAVDGTHHHWFETQEEALAAAREDPGIRTSRTSWVNDIGSALELVDMILDEPIEYNEIFNI